ncbi:hypothetical protein Tco_0492250 [Tanacetum coccineum]
MLGKKPNKVYDPFLKAGLGYKNPERLKKDITAQPKMYDGERLHSGKLTIDSPDSEETLEDAKESRLNMRNKMVQINYGKLNALYEIFVPQQEFFVEQPYFSIPSTSNNGSESKEVTLDLPIQKLQKEKDRQRRWMSDSQNSLREFYKIDVIPMSESLSKNLKELKEELSEENKLQTIDKGKNVNTKFDKSETSRTLLCVTPFPKNIAVKAKKVSNTKINTDRSKPVTSHLTPKNEQSQKNNENVLARGISNSVRRPKLKDTKSKDRVLKNNNVKRPYAHVQMMSSSVSIDSNRHETMNSNKWVAKLSTLPSAFASCDTCDPARTVRFGNDHFAPFTGYVDYVKGNLTINSLDLDDQVLKERFQEYTSKELQTFRHELISYMDRLEILIDRRALHESECLMKAREGIELDASLDSKASTDDTTSTKQQDESSSLGHAADAERAQVDKDDVVGPSFDKDTLPEANREAQQAKDNLTKGLEIFKEKLFPKQTTNELEYCKKIKFLNDDISKSQTCQKEKSFHKENGKYAHVSLTSKIDRDSRYDICMKLLLKNINIFFKQSKFTTSRDGYEIEGELKEYEDSRIKTSVQVFYKEMLNHYHRVQDLSSATSCD